MTCSTLTPNGPSAPGGTSLEPRECLSAVSSLVNLYSDLHHVLTSLLPSLSTRAYESTPLLSILTSGHPALMFHLAIDLYNRMLYFCQPSCREGEVIGLM